MGEGKAGRILGRSALALVWLLFIAFAVATGLEVASTVEHERKDRRRTPEHPRYEQLVRAYAPFTVQHINPFFLFFFPFSQAERAKIGNAVCRVDEDSFRGPGPAQAGTRKLAFLLGGSTAFGHFSSSDTTTISGYLNQVQTEFFFVNAGVPSWSSTQELFRLVQQLLEHEPALVISLGGANDLRIPEKYFRKHLTYPVGTPESFDALYALVGDIRAGHVRPPPEEPLYARLLPRMTRKVRRRLGLELRNLPATVPFPEDRIEQTAEKWVFNLGVMQDLGASRGFRFLAVFQPVRGLHRNVPAKFRDPLQVAAMRKFRASAAEKRRADVEYRDLSSFFDGRYAAVSVFDTEGPADLDEDVIFVDEVHLTDRGNRLVAEAISQYLENPPPAAP